MHKLKTLAPLLFALTLSAFAADAPKPPAEAEASISPTELHMNLDFLASKELGGRYTLSPSFPIAARFLASRLLGYGYKPAGDNGSYFQHFEVISAKAKPEQSKLNVAVNGSSKDFEYGKFFTSGVTDANLDGEVVFVGYGISSPSLK